MSDISVKHRDTYVRYDEARDVWRVGADEFHSLKAAKASLDAKDRRERSVNVKAYYFARKADYSGYQLEPVTIHSVARGRGRKAYGDYVNGRRQNGDAQQFSLSDLHPRSSEAEAAFLEWERLDAIRATAYEAAANAKRAIPTLTMDALEAALPNTEAA